jgi:hypothetical protein
MQATVTKAFPGRPDNESKVRTIEVGEVIDGSLAEVAVREKWAVRGVAEPERKAEKRNNKRDEGQGEGE